MNIVTKIKHFRRRHHLLRLRFNYQKRLWEEWLVSLKEAKNGTDHRGYSTYHNSDKGDSLPEYGSFVSSGFVLSFSLQGNSDAITFEFDHAIINKLFNDKVKVEKFRSFIQLIERNVI